MTPFRVSVFAALASILLLVVIFDGSMLLIAAGVVVIFELIRSRRLQERYALLWLVTGLVLLVLAVWRNGLNLLSKTVGIAYPPSALFLVVGLFVLVVLLHYSTVISELSERNLVLAQRIALLEQKLGEDEPRGRDQS